MKKFDKITQNRRTLAEAMVYQVDTNWFCDASGKPYKYAFLSNITDRYYTNRETAIEECMKKLEEEVK